MITVKLLSETECIEQFETITPTLQASVLGKPVEGSRKAS